MNQNNKIILCINPAGNSSVPGNVTWLRNLYEPIIDLGYDVHLIRIDEVAKVLGVKRGSKRFKEKFSQYLLDKIKLLQTNFEYSLFLSYFRDSDIDEGCLSEIKRFGLIIANFSCNNTHQFQLVKKISPFCDYNLHSEKTSVEKFRSIKANPIWFPMAANPKYYKPISVTRNEDVSFVGGLYSQRPYYIRHLLENGINVDAYGPGWKDPGNKTFLRNVKKELVRIKLLIKTLFSFNSTERLKLSSTIAKNDFVRILKSDYKKRLHYPISDNEMIRKYSSSKISLGFLEVDMGNERSGRKDQHLHLREFEAPMSGALYFTNYCEELFEFYEPNKEIVIFRNEHELLDKVKYYLKKSNSSEAEKIRLGGYKRAINCHTYQLRYQKLFQKIKI